MRTILSATLLLTLCVPLAANAAPNAATSARKMNSPAGVKVHWTKPYSVPRSLVTIVKADAKAFVNKMKTDQNLRERMRASSYQLKGKIEVVVGTVDNEPGDNLPGARHLTALIKTQGLFGPEFSFTKGLYARPIDAKTKEVSATSGWSPLKRYGY